MPIAFIFNGLNGSGRTNTIDPRAGELRVTKKRKRFGEKAEVIPLAVEQCSEKHYGNLMLAESYQQHIFDTYLCVQPDVDLNGQKSLDNSTQVQMEVGLCESQQEDECMNSTEIQAYFSLASIQFVKPITFIDYDDLENPV